MKNKIFLFTILFTQILFAQHKKHSGILINKKTKNPVFGATVLLNNRIIAISNEKGEFEFKIDEGGSKEFVKISHQSYEIDSVQIENINERSRVIKLVETFTKLKEVVLISKFSKGEIIKKAIEQFEITKREKPYWASINFKQTLGRDENAEAYYEMDGHAFMIGENENPFVGPVFVQNQIRRTRESLGITNTWLTYYPGYLKVSHYISLSSLCNYRCFETAHPLSLSTYESFDYKIEKIVVIDGEEFYLIQYRQNKKINRSSDFYDMNGQLWVNKNDYTLKKSTVKFNYNNAYNCEVKADYRKINNIIYPLEIYTIEQGYKDIGEQYITNMITKGLMTFNDVYTEEIRNHRKWHPIYLTGYIIADKYDKEYWHDKPVNDEMFRKDVLGIVGSNDWDLEFKQGSEEKQYKERSIINLAIHQYKEKDQKLLRKLNEDLNIK